MGRWIAVVLAGSLLTGCVESASNFVAHEPEAVAPVSGIYKDPEGKLWVASSLGEQGVATLPDDADGLKSTPLFLEPLEGADGEYLALGALKLDDDLYSHFIARKGADRASLEIFTASTEAYCGENLRCVVASREELESYRDWMLKEIGECRASIGAPGAAFTCPNGRVNALPLAPL